ncbi:DUF423 domain-containing protein [bacterium]|nr:DUF423 domain-containing protein [bacterium]
MDFFKIIAGLAGFSGVVIGAFGAHGLKGKISPEMLKIYETGVLYHLIHAAVIVFLVSTGKDSKTILCFLAGIMLFSGSLYALAITQIKTLGMITPIGGVLFLAGWFLIFWDGIQTK